MIATLILFFSALLFLGCSDSEVAGGTSIDQGIVALEKWKVEGVSQKGPFITGSTVSVLELGGNSLLQTGKVFKSSIKSDKGDFVVAGTDLISQYALIEVNGYYRNEITGLKSSSPLTLNAIVDLSDREKANVNLLTHLEFERVKKLVAEGKSVADAKAQAEREILETMAMNESSGAFEDLDIFKSGEGNAKLLAISILLQGDEDVAGFTERLGKFSMELARSGSWNDSVTRTTIADWAFTKELRHKYEEIIENILKWGLTDSLPVFEKYTALFWADNYGLGKCSDSNKGDTVQNANPLSKWATEKFVCDGTRWFSSRERKRDSNIEFGTLTDERDGQTYKTVQIGEQVWMAENLNYNYQTELTHSMCIYNKEENCSKYGRLYSIAAAVDSAGLFGDGGLGCGNIQGTCDLKESSRGVCPEGWHLPSINEWKQLFETVGGGAKALTALRTNDGIGTDDYGFNIIDAGCYFSGFCDVGNSDYSDAYFWTSSDYDDFSGIKYGDGLSYLIFDVYNDVDYQLSLPSFQVNFGIDAIPVRCVKD